jgi:DNA-binding HxlR family transcriptional regulator
MTNQAYGQFCGLARALEVVGEPWALMVVRDLLTGSKSFADLRHGLPRVPAGTLSERLEELEQADVVRHRSASDPAKDAVYELTQYGRELDDIVVGLGRWGAKKLGGPRRDEIVTSSSMVTALRSTFRPEAAHGLVVNYLFRLGPIDIHARVDDGHADIGPGLIDDADLIIEAGPALKALMAGEMSSREAIESGSVRLTGDPGLLEWFTELFHIPPAPPTPPTRPTPADTHAGASFVAQAAPPAPAAPAPAEAAGQVTAHA